MIYPREDNIPARQMKMVMNVRFPPGRSTPWSGRGRRVRSFAGFLMISSRNQSISCAGWGTRGCGRHRGDWFLRHSVFAEPFFLNFNADREFRVAMTPADLAAAGLEELGKNGGNW